MNFTERAGAEAEVLILCPPDAKSWLIRRGLDAGKYWRQEVKGMTEEKMIGWPHQLDGHEFEQALGAGEGLRGFVCCSPRGHKESDTTEWLSNKNNQLNKNALIRMCSLWPNSQPGEARAPNLGLSGEMEMDK